MEREQREQNAQGKGYPGPSSGGPGPDGLEGSIFEEDGGERAPDAATAADSSDTGAGGEAAEGLHSAQQERDEGEKSATPASDQADGMERKGTERKGSEPLTERGQHKGSYGGEGGEPRVSSDQRE